MSYTNLVSKTFDDGNGTCCGLRQNKRRFVRTNLHDLRDVIVDSFFVVETRCLNGKPFPHDVCFPHQGYYENGNFILLAIFASDRNNATHTISRCRLCTIRYHAKEYQIDFGRVRRQLENKYCVVLCWNSCV